MIHVLKLLKNQYFTVDVMLRLVALEFLSAILIPAVGVRMFTFSQLHTDEFSMFAHLASCRRTHEVIIISYNLYKLGYPGYSAPEEGQKFLYLPVGY